MFTKQSLYSTRLYKAGHLLPCGHLRHRLANRASQEHRTNFIMFTLALTLLLVSQTLAADLVGTLSADSRTSTLVQLVQKAGLVDALKQGTHTVFAPTDAAFSKIPADQLVALTLDTTALSKILLYHVTSGSAKSTDLKNEQQITMLDGNKARFNDYTHNHVKTINGKKIIDADIAADNGMIHIIDEVIMPPNGTIVDAVANNPQFSTLLTAIQKAGIANEFLANPMTVFAPTNDAFNKVDSRDLNTLLGSPSRLKETLEYHAIAQCLYAKGLWNNEFPKSTDSHEDRLRVRVDSQTGAVTVNNGHVIEADINASNGVIHAIDHVLIPIRVAFWLRTHIGK